MTSSPRGGARVGVAIPAAGAGARMGGRKKPFLALAGEVDMVEVASLYASDFIAAGSTGVRTGRNDGKLRQAMAQG